MSEINRHEPGTFCWFELATTDAAKAKAFYGSLFGWTAEDLPMGEGQVYTTFKLRGRDVAACSPMTPEQLAGGIPPHWGAYVSVSDADRAAQAVERAGGVVLAQPFDVIGAGRMAIVSDAVGAVFSLWEPRGHIGAGIVHEPGAIGWVELMAPDLDAAQAFYAKVFDWKAERMEVPSGPYVLFSSRGVPMAGMMRPPCAEIPPAWLMYFEVADCDATLAACRKGGGKAEMEPVDIGEFGRFAVLSDPQDASFAVLQPRPRG